MEDWKKLKGEELCDYLMNSHEDKEMRECVELLYYFVHDRQKRFDILERMVRENKHLVAVYPGIGDKETPDMEFVTDIMDGALYMQ